MEIRDLEFVVKYLVAGKMFASTAVSMRKFNATRATLATGEKHTLNNSELVRNIRLATTVEQVFSVPKSTKCVISGDDLHEENGATIIMDLAGRKKIYCMHKRFIPHTYKLFILSHFDEHIIQQYHNWCSTQNIVPGKIDVETVDKFIAYNKNSNLKSLIVQLNA